MTNTRITDIEIVERRYPVHVRKFTLRPGSGGTGRWNGGDGVLRELYFRAPVTLSVLTERRVLQPYGLEGKWNSSVSCLSCYENVSALIAHCLTYTRNVKYYDFGFLDTKILHKCMLIYEMLDNLYSFEGLLHYKVYFLGDTD